MSEFSDWLGSLETMSIEDSENAKQESRCPKCKQQTLVKDLTEFNTHYIRQCVNCSAVVFVEKVDRRLID